MKPSYLLCLLALCWLPPAFGNEADVLAVDVRKNTDHTYNFQVTVRHDDQGWSHYADRWEILSPDGKVLATRTLYHPHVGEQPFTRGLSQVAIPPDLTRVVVRAHDSVHGYGGKELTVKLPR